MLRPFQSTVVLVFTVFLLFSVLVQALPHAHNDAGSVRARVRRQDAAFTGPQTVQTVTSTDTPEGLATETCTITLTPITDANGNEQVVEVKQCSVAVSGGDSSAIVSGTPTASLPAITSSVSDDSSLSTVAPISVLPTTSVTVSFSSGTVSSTSTTSASASSVPVADASSPSPTTSAGAISGATSTSLPADQAGTAAAENAASASSTPFTLPGKKIEVLPIGLGVFAGISVIALIVVALVTYERTKYRKAFRQRKLAETGASMGYGGMAQRV